MALTLAVFSNGDDALLVWNVDAPITGCLGFTIRRELTRDGKVRASWLDNFVGFAGETHEIGARRPSTEWPFQGFSWTDHELSTGDSARYRVVPIVRGDDGKLQRRDALRSDWAVAAPSDSRYRVFFNRGYVMSQFMARYLAQKKLTLEEFKAEISDEDDHVIRRFLSGDLRVELLDRLEEARTGPGEVFAALYELSDDELIEGLVALGPRAHVVLANGSIAAKKGEKAADARKRDQNAAGRARLVAAGVDVEDANRFLSPGALGHNKFLVFTTGTGKAKAAWTGSTNWTPTGLCTQLNNGLLVRDASVADAYLAQWRRLRAAASGFPKALVDENSRAKSPRKGATVWFTKTAQRVDLAALREVVDSAQHSLMFLMFSPGSKGILPDVLRRQKEPGLIVRGVVSDLPKPDDESVVDVTFVGDGKPDTHRLDVIQPEGRPQAIARWAEEVTRKDFRARVGYAIVHSKVLVADPFSPQATVVTGSHNFSDSASTKNDENFLVVRGDRALAEAYLVNVLGAWRHYRARVRRGSPFTDLRADDSWMRGSLAARRRDVALWGF